MSLRCKVCKEEILEQQVDDAAKLARCETCGTVFTYDLKATMTGQRTWIERPCVKFRKGLQITDTSEELLISWRWFGIDSLVSALIWLIFAVMILYKLFIAAPKRSTTQNQVEVIMLLIAWAAMGYWIVAKFINQTTISVTSSLVRIFNRPLPWFGNVSLSTARIVQLFCRQVKRRSKYEMEITYEIRAQTNDGVDYLILSGLHDASQALYIEQEMERRMGIQNRRVAGDYR